MRKNYSEGECTPFMLQLPDDCLILIFRRLNWSKDRESFGLTCKRWLQIQNHCRRSLQFQCSLTILDRSSLVGNIGSVESYHLQRLLCRFNHLHRLSLSGCTEISDSSLSQLRLSGSKLTILNLDCCFGISDSGLSIVAEGCPSLMVLSLYRCTITDIGLEVVAKGCSNITHMDLSYCSKVSDKGLRSLVKSCSRLEAIKLSACQRVRGFGLNNCSRTLSYVDVELCKLDLEAIKEILSLPGLEFLSLSGVTTPISSTGFVAIDAGFSSHLTILNLRMCQAVGDDCIIAIAKGCQFLEELNLALCHEVRIAGWQAIGKFCNNLDRLHVNRCHNLHDEALEALKEGCKKLSVLYMTRGRFPTALAIELFKLRRGSVIIKNEEIVSIGPRWLSI